MPNNPDAAALLVVIRSALLRWTDERADPNDLPARMVRSWHFDLAEVIAKSLASTPLLPGVSELAASRLQDHMEQFHGVCLKASEWDAALLAALAASPAPQSGSKFTLTPVMDRALRAANLRSPTATPSPLPDVGVKPCTKPCTMGVGCDEAGMCYADAHGQPEQCPRNADEGVKALVERLMACHPPAPNSHMANMVATPILVNPDGPAAAALIERLSTADRRDEVMRAENARLRRKLAEMGVTLIEDVDGHIDALRSRKEAE